MGITSGTRRVASSDRMGVLGAALLAVAVARVASSALPGMWAWGLNLPRFTPSALGWALSLAPVAWAIPAIARPLGAAVARSGDALTRSGRTRLLVALVLGLLVAGLDDRTWFTGDFLLRRGAAAWGGLEGTFRQSLPLEILIFERVPRLLAGLGAPGPEFARAIGVLAALGLGFAAADIGRLLGRGVSAAAITAVVAFGGHLVVFSGLGKPAGVEAALTAVTAALSLRAVRGNDSLKPLAGLGLVVAAALALHRCGVLLLPCWLFVVLSRAAAIRAPSSREVAWLALCFAPLVALVAAGPSIAEILLSYDLPFHVVSPPIVPPRQPWSLPGLALRALDVANLIFVMTPAGLPLIAMLLPRSRSSQRDPRLRIGMLLAGPWILVACVVLPQQGVFRDLDVFAPAAVAIGILGACVLAVSPESRGPRACGAIVVLSIAASIQLLACYHRTSWGLARVEAYIRESPHRSDVERAKSWDFVALRAFAVRDWALAARASREVVRSAPSPRLLLMSAISSTYVGDFQGAKNAYLQVLTRTPAEPVAWIGLAGAAMRTGDSALADSAFRRLRLCRPGGPEARQIREFVEHYPQVLPHASGSRR